MQVLGYLLIYRDYWMGGHGFIKKVIGQFDDSCIDMLRPFQLKTLGTAVLQVHGPASIWKKVDNKLHEILTKEPAEGSTEDADHVHQSSIPVLSVISISLISISVI